MPRTREPNTPRRSSGRATGRGDEIAERRARALEEPLDLRRLPGPFVRLEVRNPIHRTHYQVLLPTYPSRDAAMCTCTDFSRSGLGTCKHVEAALRWMAAHPGEVADPEPGQAEAPLSWGEIDRRRHSVPRHASPARRMTWVGDLFAEKRSVEKGEKEGVSNRAGRGAKA